MILIQQLLNGLNSGSIYALVALGYSMVYGIVLLINFAHGDIIMVGGFIFYTVLVSLKLPLWIAIIITVLSCMLVGLLVERIAYRRLLKLQVPRITLLITAIGVSTFLQSLFERIYGSGEQSFGQIFNLPPITVGSLNISVTILNTLTSVAIMVLLLLIVNKTKIGKAMRATSEDMGAAKLMGINTLQVIAFTFAIGSLIAGIGSVLYVNKFQQINPYIGNQLGLKAFVSAVVGGIGNIQGAMLGGFLLGIAEALVIAAGGSSYSDAVVFALLILVLIFKPAGLLGKATKEKV